MDLGQALSRVYRNTREDSDWLCSHGITPEPTTMAYRLAYRVL